MKDEERKYLWSLVIPGRDTREAELSCLDEKILKAGEELGNEFLDNIMHAGVFAYSAASYLVRALESVHYLDESSKVKNAVETECFKQVLQDLIHGAEGHHKHVFNDETEHLDNMISWISSVFEAAKEDV